MLSCLMYCGLQVSKDFRPGEMVWVEPWEASHSAAWPLGYRALGLVCEKVKSSSAYHVIVDGKVKRIPEDALVGVDT